MSYKIWIVLLIYLVSSCYPSTPNDLDKRDGHLYGNTGFDRGHRPFEHEIEKAVRDGDTQKYQEYLKKAPYLQTHIPRNSSKNIAPRPATIRYLQRPYARSPYPKKQYKKKDQEEFIGPNAPNFSPQQQFKY